MKINTMSIAKYLTVLIGIVGASLILLGSDQNVIKETAADREIDKLSRYLNENNVKEKYVGMKLLIDQLQRHPNINKILMSKGFDFYTADFNGAIYEGDINSKYLKTELAKMGVSKNMKEVYTWILELIDKNLYGFDKRIEMGYINIYVQPNLFVHFLLNDVNRRHLEYLYKKVEKGEDYRGDFWVKISDNVFIASKRR